MLYLFEIMETYFYRFRPFADLEQLLILFNLLKLLSHEAVKKFGDDSWIVLNYSKFRKDR